MDGYSEKPEIEQLLAACKALASPGEVLHGVAEQAIEAFRNLDYVNERKAADWLAEAMIPVLRRWHKLMKSMQGKT